MRSSLLILSIILLIGCQKQSSNKNRAAEDPGLRVTRYANGNVKTEIRYNDGQKHGLSKMYYENGNLQMEVNYKDNIKDGLAKTYYKDGGIYLETPYKNGKIDGIRKKYHDNGNLMSEIPYRKGQLGIGLKEYDTQGRFMERDNRLVFEEVDQIAEAGRFILFAKTAEGHRDVEYFSGELLEGKYLHSNLEGLPARNGKMELRFHPPAGRPMQKTINIIAVAHTKQRNKQIIQREYRLQIAP